MFYTVLINLYLFINCINMHHFGIFYSRNEIRTMLLPLKLIYLGQLTSYICTNTLDNNLFLGNKILKLYFVLSYSADLKNRI